jgi:16S rRNA (guanine1207-N2)-methyltransferase
MNKVMASAVYGAPTLAAAPAGALQVSPLIPGAPALEDAPDASLDSIVIAAPPGAIERRYVLAQALRALKVGGELTATAPKDKGGLRLRKELETFGCAVAEQALRHQRLCQCVGPEAPIGLAEAIAAGGAQTPGRLGLSSQPGVFSWDRPDPGSLILARHLGGLAGAGADLGCGVGVLALALLAAAPKVTALALVDIDRRAVEAARRNFADPRVSFLQADLREPAPTLSNLDFVVMNPPFHDGGEEDRGLGQAFVRRAAASLRRGGLLRLVANIGLPYEASLADSFDHLRRLEQGGGYKVLEGRRT